MAELGVVRERGSLGARMSRGVVVSVATTLLSAIVLVALTVGANVGAQTANVFAVACGIAPSYVWSRRYVWQQTGRGNVKYEALPFWSLALAGLIASTLAVGRADSILHSASTSARSIALPAVSLAVFGLRWGVQFVVCDRIIFRARGVNASASQSGNV